MITPNKFVSFDESVLSQLDTILDPTVDADSVRDLYHSVASHFETAEDFLLALDVLYILGRVDIDMATGTIARVA